MRLAELLPGRTVAGFYTEEIRGPKGRQGFRAVTFAGQTATLAHVSSRSRSRVGRYGVEVADFEALVLPELARRCDLIIIDEIGKMECFSSGFVFAARELLDGAVPVVATVAIKGGGFIAEVKARPDVEICEVTTLNRDGLPQRLAEDRRVQGTG
jgi:nucleoside-triphosphatase